MPPSWHQTETQKFSSSLFYWSLRSPSHTSNGLVFAKVIVLLLLFLFVRSHLTFYFSSSYFSLSSSSFFSK